MRFKPHARRLASASLAVSLLGSSAGAAATPTYDVLIRGGRIYDGSGAKAFVGDVALKGDRIVYVGPHAPGKATRIVEAAGQAVAPGFINAMSQSDDTLLSDPTAGSDLRQGVTLEIMGEGGSPGPARETALRAGDPRTSWPTLGAYFTDVERKGVSVNFASWVGATSVRTYVLGEANVKPDAIQLAEMRGLVHQAMQDGALGLSTALIYVPATFADTDELVALAGESAKCGGMYVSHMRSEGDRFEEALEELIEIARRSGGPAEVFHIKVGGIHNWPKMQSALARIRRARAEGVRITADMYPYVAAGTGMSAALPPWAQEGGLQALLARLKDPAIRARVIAEMQDPAPTYENAMLGAGGAKGVMLANFRSEAMRPLVGKTLADVAAARGVSPEEAALELIEEDGSRVGVFYFVMSEDNLRTQMREPYVSFGSDAAGVSLGAGGESGSHPRAYGTFSRVFAKYVREDKVLTLEEAVRRMTSLPATNYSLADRGALKVGYFADVVVFDPDTVQDHATYAAPRVYATGVRDVFVNGVQALAAGAPTAARPGRAVRGRAWTGGEGGGCRTRAADWIWR